MYIIVFKIVLSKNVFHTGKNNLKILGFDLWKDSELLIKRFCLVLVFLKLISSCIKMFDVLSVNMKIPIYICYDYIISITE